MKPLERILEGEHAGKIVFYGKPQTLPSIIGHIDAVWKQSGPLAVANRIEDVVAHIDWTQRVTYQLTLPKNRRDGGASFDCPLCELKHTHGWKPMTPNVPAGRVAHHYEYFKIKGISYRKLEQWKQPVAIWDNDWNLHLDESKAWSFLNPHSLEPYYNVVIC